LHLIQDILDLPFVLGEIPDYVFFEFDQELMRHVILLDFFGLERARSSGTRADQEDD
jgi:hypothetical protein